MVEYIEYIETCPVCGSVSDYIGTMGILDWYLCKGCGMQWNLPVDEDALEEYGGYDG